VHARTRVMRGEDVSKKAQRRGRPPKLTAEVLAGLSDAFGRGLSQSRAGGLMGVTTRSVERWCSLGRQLLAADSGDEEVTDEVEYTAHHRRCMSLSLVWERARAEIAQRCTAVLLRAAVGVRDKDTGEQLVEPDPKYAELVLRRIDPKFWGDRCSHEHTARDGVPLIPGGTGSSTARRVIIEVVSNGRGPGE